MWGASGSIRETHLCIPISGHIYYNCWLAGLVGGGAPIVINPSNVCRSNFYHVEVGIHDTRPAQHVQGVSQRCCRSFGTSKSPVIESTASPALVSTQSRWRWLERCTVTVHLGCLVARTTNTMQCHRTVLCCSIRIPLSSYARDLPRNQPTLYLMPIPS